MSDKKKDRPWDGRSRISTKQYRKTIMKYLKNKKQLLKTLLSPMIHLRNLTSALIFKLMQK